MNGGEGNSEGEGCHVNKLPYFKVGNRWYIDKDWLYEKYVIEGLSVLDLSKIIGCNWSTVKKNLEKCGIPIRGISESKRLKNNGCLNLELSIELAYILGVIEGDGCVSRDRIVLSAIDKDFVDEFERNLRAIGIKKITRGIVEKSKKNPKWKDQYEVCAFSLDFVEWYEGLNKYDEYVRMFGDSEEMMCAFLRGTFDSEGTVYVKYNNFGDVISGEISFCNTNKGLIDLCCLFLDRLGIRY